MSLQEFLKDADVDNEEESAAAADLITARGEMAAGEDLLLGWGQEVETQQLNQGPCSVPG